MNNDRRRYRRTRNGTLRPRFKPGQLLALGVAALVLTCGVFGMVHVGCGPSRCSVRLFNIVSVEVGTPASSEDGEGVWHCATQGHGNCGSPQWTDHEPPESNVDSWLQGYEQGREDQAAVDGVHYGQ